MDAKTPHRPQIILWVELPAARTRVGRERLDVLLKEMENDAARSPGPGTMDVGRIRAELGLED